jgi:hypothetical protein
VNRIGPAPRQIQLKWAGLRLPAAAHEPTPAVSGTQFHGRFKEGVARKSLHEKLRYHFPLKRGARNVSNTLFYDDYDDRHDAVWVFVQSMD